MEDELYAVTVWDVANGDVVKRLYGVTEDELRGVEEQYGDEPMYEILVEYV